jgi:LacI family transcriptional regulator
MSTASSKSPTIHDVAKRAGVSLSTVSRVLNDSESVNPQTREKVEAAIKELHYEKSKPESAKSVKKSRIVGLIIPDLLNPFFPLLIHGIDQVSKIHNYSLMLCDSEDSAELEHQHISTLCERGVAGIILIPTSEATYPEQLLKKECPFVFLDRFIEVDGASYVTSDNEEGAYQATKYLLKLGHRRIMILTGPPDLSTEQARLRGVQQALGEEGIRYDDELCVMGNYHTEEGYQVVRSMLQKGRDFTAIFAMNDMMAFGAKKALEEQGIRIPDEISLVGYDDILFSSIISLTSVSQPTYEMGRNAMVLLLDLIHGRITPPQHIVLRPSMVIRGSCKRR